jgi:glycosyltransferase involved in cell wall biosynthesis
MEAGRPVTRVAFVSPEPTPYRSPLLDRVAATGGIDLTVVYAAQTVANRTWKVEPLHRAVFLDGLKIPGVHGLFRHDYPVTPGIWRALREAHPDCVVVSGWSTFAAQAALSWCRARRVPYVLLVESHDEGPKPGWRRRVKETVVPPIVKRAASVLVTGSLARESMVRQGADPERVRVFANTIDVVRYGERADELAGRRDEFRAELGLSPEDVAVLTVARLAAEKGIDTLLRAAARARLPVVVAGEGPDRAQLERLAGELEVRVTFTSRPWDRVVELYVAADVFALLSTHEPWGVVVNEAAACGLPLVLSDRVGAARDLLQDGENGVLVPAVDVEAAAAAFRRLAGDIDLRKRMGARSPDLARGFGYGPSVDNLLAAVREATASR